MKDFVHLIVALDRSNSTLDKVAAMRGYLERAPMADGAWAVYFLAGGRPQRLVSTRVMRDAVHQMTGMPEWLFDECYEAVGDLAETIALLLPECALADGASPPLVRSNPDSGLDHWMRERLLPMRRLEPEAARLALAEYWGLLDAQGRFVFNKLITGGLRLGVSRQLALRALAESSGVDARLLAQRIIGYTDRTRLPDAARYSALIEAPRSSAPGAAPDSGAASSSVDPASLLLPYPFMLANGWDPAQAAATRADEWLAEWKWDGIRAQIVRRADTVALWSRGEELLTDRFPEIVAAARALPSGTVLDGELLCWAPDAPRPMDFAAMQTRVGRLRPGASTLRNAPAVFVAFDCLERGQVDLRARPLIERRQVLLALLGGREPERMTTAVLRAAPALAAPDWASRASLRESARTQGAEGLMLKRLDSAYGIGRSRADGGSWFKWKLDPFSVDAVLIYAQAGHGRRAGLFTDYTFAVWDDGEGSERRLVPFAKAYSGLNDAEIREVDAIVRRTTLERFGPVRSVEPSQVFEIGFEGIARSARHRAGISVRFPRMLRWRRDKPATEADSLGTLRALLAISRA